MHYKETVKDKFIRYAKINTTADDYSETSPSTQCQHDLAKLLIKELEEMGADEVYYDKTHCYVYAAVPANDGSENNPLPKGVGFIAHMDTSPDASGENVKPVEHKYQGGDIKLNDNVILSPEEFPELNLLVGKTILTSDGTTLLGADDKAGVSEIMVMAQYLLENPDIKHGRIAICFTPDEEVGRGTDYFDIKRFGAKYAYTVDGDKLGTLEYENFNAAAAKVKITGRNVHPGHAKNKMINALRVAMEFDALLPLSERPDTTENYEGFWHLTDLKGDVEGATLEYIIRDHDKEIFNERKKKMEEAVKVLNEKYGNGTVELILKEQYENMKEYLKDAMFLIDNAKAAMESAGITPIIQPVRGGTDGARLSVLGLPCPNLCTGGDNFHGRYEYVCVDSMEKVCEMLIEIAKKHEDR